MVHIGAFRGEQLYEVEEDPLLRKAHGLDLSLRHVLAGRFVGLEAGLERRFVETPRQRLYAAARVFVAGDALGSDLGFARALVAASYSVAVGAPEGTLLEPSILAAQVHWGRGSDATPLDEMFAPGGSPEMELPLRAHQQTHDGTLGATPLGRSMTLANLEWRRRLVGTPFVQAGLVTFCDLAWIGRTAVQGDPDHSFQDLGLGIRIGLGGSSVVRFNYAHGLADGKDAFFFGLNQIF